MHGTEGTHGTESSEVNISGATLEQVRALTWADELLYARGMVRLQKELASLDWQCLLL